MAYFKKKNYRGTTYSLDHLDPFAFVISENEVEFRIWVEFSCHCFTEEKQVWHAPDTIYQHENEIRAFCTQRHNYSRRLPALTRSINERSVYFGEEYNFFSISNTDLRGNGPPYLIFFDVYKSHNKKKGNAILKIRSAYIKPNMTERAAPVSFFDLVQSKLNKTSLTPGRRVVIKRE